MYLVVLCFSGQCYVIPREKYVGLHIFQTEICQWQILILKHWLNIFRYSERNMMMKEKAVAKTNVRHCRPLPTSSQYIVTRIVNWSSFTNCLVERWRIYSWRDVWKDTSVYLLLHNFEGKIIMSFFYTKKAMSLFAIVWRWYYVGRYYFLTNYPAVLWVFIYVNVSAKLTYLLFSESTLTDAWSVT